MCYSGTEGDLFVIKLTYIAVALALTVSSAFGQATPPQTAKDDSLPMERKVAILEILKKEGMASIRPDGLKVAIGENVPQQVNVRPLPASAMQYAPSFQGHSYLVVEESFIIVEGVSRKIVAVMP